MMHHWHMTTERTEHIPPLTLGWRLKMALRNMTRQQMADHLGVDPGTLSRWMADKGAPPRRAYIVQWALATGVPVQWLEHGTTPHDNGPGNDGSRTTPDNRYSLRLAS